MLSKVIKKYLPLVLFLLLAFALLYEATTNTPTYDEPANMAAAFDYVYKNDYRVYPDNPPLIKLLAGVSLYPLRKTINFPSHFETYQNPKKFDLYVFGTEFLYRSNNNPKLIARLTRLPNIFITIALGILLYHFAKKLYGEKAGILALFLYTLDPNIRGHGHILAFDLPLAFFSLFIFYLTFQMFLYPKKKQFCFLLISLCFFLGFLTKFTFIFVGIIYSIGVILLPKKNLFPNWKIKAIFIACLFLFSFLLLWLFGIATNYSQKTFDYDGIPIIQSANEKLAKNFLWQTLKNLPLPYFYKTGIQVMYTHNLVSQPAFLFDEVRSKNDWFFYFPISFILKTPLPTLFVMLLTVFLLIKKFLLGKKLLVRCFFPFLTGGAFFLLMMVFSHINNTYRYLFPSYIFFILGASQLVNWLDFRKKSVKIFIILNSCFLLLTSYFSFPYDLSYTNELTGIPPKGYKYLSDSEIDWGQDLERLAKWLKENKLDDETIILSYLGTADPTYYGIKYKPLKFEDLENLFGIVAISVGNLTLGDWEIKSSFDYKLGLIKRAPLDVLRDRKPDTIIGKSIFVYKFK